MKECDKCGETISMPYNCNRCGGYYCSDHRLPEKHNCSMLDRGSTPNDVVIEKDSKQNNKLANYIEYIKSYMPDKVTNLFLLIMVIVYIFQIIILSIFGISVHNLLFVLEPQNIEHLWTWISSIFSHSPENIFHLISNLIVIFFFGSLLEDKIGSKKFAQLFVFSGSVAGISQLITNILLSDPSGVLGASGAGLCILGVLTVYKPKMDVYLYFMIPIPLWVITISYTIYSIFGATGFTGTGIAHTAHLIGLLIGLIYGYNTKNKYNIKNNHNITEKYR